MQNDDMCDTHSGTGILMVVMSAQMRYIVIFLLSHPLRVRG